VKRIDANTVRQRLELEKKRLRDRRKQDHDDNRARHSAATEDAVSRVLMLEDLLEGEAA
jgi:hypothetical protein